MLNKNLGTVRQYAANAVNAMLLALVILAMLPIMTVLAIKDKFNNED